MYVYVYVWRFARDCTCCVCLFFKAWGVGIVASICNCVSF